MLQNKCLFILLRKYIDEGSNVKMCALCLVSPRISWKRYLSWWVCSWETDIINNWIYKSTYKVTTVRNSLIPCVVFLSFVFKMLIFISSLNNSFRCDVDENCLFYFLKMRLWTQSSSQYFPSKCCFGNLTQKDYLINIVLFSK